MLYELLIISIFLIICLTNSNNRFKNTTSFFGQAKLHQLSSNRLQIAEITIPEIYFYCYSFAYPSKF